jgi:hypothetical protein
MRRTVARTASLRRAGRLHREPRLDDGVPQRAASEGASGTAVRAPHVGPTRAWFSRRSQGASRQRLTPLPSTTCDVAKEIGILWAVVLSKIHVQISYPSSLFCIEGEGSSSPGRRGVHQDLLRCVMHCVTNDKGPSLRVACTVPGVVINLSSCRIDRSAHEVDVSDRMADLGQDGLRGLRAKAAQHFLDKSARTPVPAGGDSCRPEPKPGTLKVKARRSNGTTRRHGRTSEIEGLAQ